MSKTDSTESLESLAKDLRYDAEIGHFYWVRPKQGRNLSKPAGGINKEGYWVLRAFGRHVLAHRLAWFAIHGAWPNGEIDHINGNILDNRPHNLRDVDKSTNQQNQRKAHVGSKTGLIGAHATDKGDFRSGIRINGRQMSLGRFKTAEQAHEAYVTAKRAMHKGCTI